MLDLVPAPARDVTRHEQAVHATALNIAREWACTIVPNPPSAVLLVERRCASPARDVHVLIDGRPAKDHPTVYVDATVPEAVRSGTTLEYHLVLPGGRPQFDTIEVRWIDDRGRPRACLCIAADDALES